MQPRRARARSEATTPPGTVAPPARHASRIGTCPTSRAPGADVFFGVDDGITSQSLQVSSGHAHADAPVPGLIGSPSSWIRLKRPSSGGRIACAGSIGRDRAHVGDLVPAEVRRGDRGAARWCRRRTAARARSLGARATRRRRSTTSARRSTAQAEARRGQAAIAARSIGAGTALAACSWGTALVLFVMPTASRSPRPRAVPQEVGYGFGHERRRVGSRRRRAPSLRPSPPRPLTRACTFDTALDPPLGKS